MEGGPFVFSAIGIVRLLQRYIRLTVQPTTGLYSRQILFNFRQRQCLQAGQRILRSPCVVGSGCIVQLLRTRCHELLAQLASLQLLQSFYPLL